MYDPRAQKEQIKRIQFILSVTFLVLFILQWRSKRKPIKLREKSSQMAHDSTTKRLFVCGVDPWNIRNEFYFAFFHVCAHRFLIMVQKFMLLLSVLFLCSNFCFSSLAYMLESSCGKVMSL